MSQSQAISQKQYIQALSSCGKFNNDVEGSVYFTLISADLSDNIKRKYIHIPESEQILEIRLQKEESTTSVFIGNYVQSGCDFLLINEIDPLFLVIPYLLDARVKVDQENQGKKQDYDVCFKLRGNQQTQQEQEAIDIIKNNKRVKKNLDKICSVADYGGDQFVRLENELLFKWIDNKVEKIRNIFKQDLNIYGINSILKKDQTQKEESLYLALDVVSQYLPKALFLQYISKSHNVAEAEIKQFNETKKSKKDINEQDIQNISLSDKYEQQNNQTNNKKQKKPEISTADKKNQEAAKGTKSIMSFFAKKK